MNNIRKNFIPASIVKRYFNCSNSSLINWASQGKIKFIKSPGGKRFYLFEDIIKISGISIEMENRKTICYARVSSSKQKEDLKRQVSLLKDIYPNEEIITDIGSGLNYNRRGLQNLLKRISNKEIDRVIVTYKDRLCRYGIELIEWIFNYFNVELKILSKNNELLEDPSISDFSRDILDICNYFVAKYNGKKAKKYKEIRKNKHFKK